MTKLLEKALEAVRRLPPDSQDQIALAMLTLTGNEGEPEDIDAAHLPAVLEGLAQAKRRQFATDSEVEAAFHAFDK
ncbi:hypothetical protein [Bradyrhizobium prioriisuperbiae]|uniref:hypothetical protein n=1 Tax=Bradyrhizobium prioriisuperbiae TaxID=2854389 RepID=UPI0028EEE4F1|nr:hypothetical protein [Bradyrhizobium prioritasuperba]